MKNASRIPAKISCVSIRAITWNCSRAITTVAMVKRTARKRKAEDSSSAFFTTTNVTPQISEQNISDRSAFFRASIRGTIHANCPDSVSVIAREKAGKVNVPPTDTPIAAWTRQKKNDLLFLIDGAAADNGLQNFHVEDLFRRGLGQVLRQDDEVGVFALFQVAFFALFKLRVCGTSGVRADTIFQRDFFLRLPAAGRTAFG